VSISEKKRLGVQYKSVPNKGRGDRHIERKKEEEKRYKMKHIRGRQMAF